MSIAYAGLGRYKKAYEYHTDYHQLHDEILSKENIERMNELEVQYQTEKKEQELIIKKNKIKLLEERKQKAENEKWFLLISLIGALSLAIAIVYGLRQKMKRNKIQREKLDSDLAFKEKELTTHALHLAHKNEVLLDLKSQLKELKSSSPNSRNYQKVINTINLDINNDNNWEQFRTYFEDVHKDFNSKVMQSYPEVSNNDLRLMSLLKMNLSSKEIANILNISIEGVKKARYRLRKKLNLNTEESLQELVIEL
jgi:DNA-binding CsgD family transcriptional regulator